MYPSDLIFEDPDPFHDPAGVRPLTPSPEEFEVDDRRMDRVLHLMREPIDQAA
jgi:hypothetical protein